MLGHVSRITILAIIIALATVMAFQHALPNTPITDATYLLAGLVGVVVASGLDWLWTLIMGKKKS